MTPETKVKNAICKFLLTHDGLYLERRQAGGFSYRAGAPDIWFVYRGRHVEVEFKAPGGTASSLQLKHEDRLRAAGSLYWRGHSPSDFERWFAEQFG
jgi:hypothetical protein